MTIADLLLSMEIDQKKFNELTEKIKKVREGKGFDLSTDEDLSIAIMNLIALEEHLFFTSEKTGKSEYLDLLNEIREMRKTMLAKMIDKHEGETWCISKHLLAATMRSMEVGTKLYSDNKKDEAKKFFDNAYKLYSLFWGLRLKLINVPDIKEMAASDKPWTLQDIVNKLVDCCDE